MLVSQKHGRLGTGLVVRGAYKVYVLRWPKKYKETECVAAKFNTNSSECQLWKTVVTKQDNFLSNSQNELFQNGRHMDM